MGVNNLPKTVTRQRRGCDLNPGSSTPVSSTLTTRLPSHANITITFCIEFTHQKNSVNKSPQTPSNRNCASAQCMMGLSDKANDRLPDWTNLEAGVILLQFFGGMLTVTRDTRPDARRPACCCCGWPSRCPLVVMTTVAEGDAGTAGAAACGGGC